MPIKITSILKQNEICVNTSHKPAATHDFPDIQVNNNFQICKFVLITASP